MEDGTIRHASQCRQAIEGITLQAPVDVSVFPENSARRFIADDGTIHIEHAELDWARLG